MKILAGGRHRRQRRLLRRADAAPGGGPGIPAHVRGDLRPGADRPRLSRRPLDRDARAGRRRQPVRAHRRRVLAGPRGGEPRRAGRCGRRPATSTSTTSPPGPWWASSRSAVRGPAAPTTRRARCSICCAGSLRGASRRRSPRPRTIATRSCSRRSPSHQSLLRIEEQRGQREGDHGGPDQHQRRPGRPRTRPVGPARAA